MKARRALKADIALVDTERYAIYSVPGRRRFPFRVYLEKRLRDDEWIRVHGYDGKQYSEFRTRAEAQSFIDSDTWERVE